MLQYIASELDINAAILGDAKSGPQDSQYEAPHRMLIVEYRELILRSVKVPKRSIRFQHPNTC